MSRKVLVTVQGPTQLINGVSAMEWYGSVTGDHDVSDAVLLIYDFLGTAEQEPPLLETITELSAMRPWKRVVFISGQEMRQVVMGSLSRALRLLRERLGEETFDEVYLMRDFNGHGSELVMRAYAKAALIQYGDAFGHVGNEAIVASLQRTLTRPSLKHRLRKQLYRLRASYMPYGKWTPRPHFNHAVMALPMDFSGKYFKHLPLHVPRRDHLQNVVRRGSTLLTDLDRYSCELLQGPGPYTLYLLSTYTASGMTNAEKEVGLYEEVIRHYSPVGSTVLLKTHPRSVGKDWQELTSRLEGDYHVRILEKYKYQPIELWATLIQRCRTVAFFSASAHSLRYLYNSEVVCGFNEGLIERYFPPACQPYMKTMSRIWIETLGKIDSWDGKEPLWQGDALKEMQGIPPG